MLEAAAFGMDSSRYGQTGLGLRAVAGGGMRGGGCFVGALSGGFGFV